MKFTKREKQLLHEAINDLIEHRQSFLEDLSPTDLATSNNGETIKEDILILESLIGKTQRGC